MERRDAIKQTISELLKIMSFEGEVFVNDVDKENILVNIQTHQAGYLIGQAGASLDALQFIARVLVNRKIQEPVR